MPRTSAFLCLLLSTLAQCGTARAADPYYELVNSYRSAEQSCKGATRPALPPLSPRLELEAAAREASLGKDPAAPLQRGAYRVQRYAALGISAPNSTSVLATLSREFCRELGDPAFRDVGIHRDKGTVWMVLAAPVALPDPAGWRTAGEALIRLVNAARAHARECGGVPYPAAPPLRWNDRLAAAALAHSEDMAVRDYFSHDSPEGTKPVERIRRAGYIHRAAGENIAAGQPTPEAALESWLKSPPHCVNLMRREFTEMGAAYAVRPESRQAIYWTQNFGAPLK